jgi:hypothetical protein
MPRRQKDPLRPLTRDEQLGLERLGRARTEPAARVARAKALLAVDGIETPILQAPLQAPQMDKNADDPELCEYLVRVSWTKTFPVNSAVWEKGMYANQNTVTKLRNKFTLDRLAERFEIVEADT